MGQKAWLGSAACLVLVASLIACEDDQKPPEQRPFEGILEFDDLCRVVRGDTTDFYPRPRGSVDTTVTPPVAGPPENYSLIGACPNPTQGPTVDIKFQIPQPDSVWLFVYDRTNSAPVDTLWAGRCPFAGVYSKAWYKPGQGGILRVEMHTRSGFTSHGDVLFSP
jgi:hypothetical protein